MKNGTILAVSNLSRNFGTVRAVDDMNLDVLEGERHAIVGPNGAGKTTAFNLISGEVSADSGQVRFRGEDVTRLSLEARVRRGIGRTFQHSDLFPSLTAFQSVVLAVQRRNNTSRAFFARPRDEQTRLDAAAALRQVGLEADADVTVRDLSHGAQRQLEIALALATGPRLLLLDEPTAGLSPGETRSMVELIRSLPAEVTVVIIEHDMDVVFSLADRVTVMHFGHILVTGEPAVVSENNEVREIYLGLDG
jgi:branched-chain amino acid transport system ATP-binding protein